MFFTYVQTFQMKVYNWIFLKVALVPSPALLASQLEAPPPPPEEMTYLRVGKAWASLFPDYRMLGMWSWADD